MIQKAVAMGNWWVAASSGQCTCSCITSHAELFATLQITQVTQTPYSPNLVPWEFWLFPKLKSPVKGKRFQTINETQENRVADRDWENVWGLKVPTLKGTEASLSYVQCFLYLVSSSINVSIFHIIWHGTFWTDLYIADLFIIIKMEYNTNIHHLVNE